MSDRQDLASDLLRGGKALAKEIYGQDDSKHIRKLYHEQNLWPVFQLDESGTLYGLKSRIRAHIEARSAQKEAEIAAAATAEKRAFKPPPRRRRTRGNAAA